MGAWKYRSRVKEVRFPSGERFALLYLGQDQLPDPHATRRSAIHRRKRGSSVSTMVHELRSIALGLDWCRARGIDIEQRIGSVEMLSSGEVVSLHDALRLNTQPREPGQRFVQPLVHYSRCVYLRDYLVWRAQSVVSRARPERQVEIRHRLEEYRKRVDSLLSKPKVGGREGLTPEHEATLRAVICPGDPRNPFRAKHQHRNHALILLYLDLPVRLSEALNLKGADLVLGGPSPLFTIQRRADDPADTRGRQPLVKTAGRVLPLGDALGSALTEWVMVHR